MLEAIGERPDLVVVTRRPGPTPARSRTSSGAIGAVLHPLAVVGARRRVGGRHRPGGRGDPGHQPVGRLGRPAGRGAPHRHPPGRRRTGTSTAGPTGLGFEPSGPGPGGRPVHLPRRRLPRLAGRAPARPAGGRRQRLGRAGARAAPGWSPGPGGVRRGHRRAGGRRGRHRDRGVPGLPALRGRPHGDPVRPEHHLRGGRACRPWSAWSTRSPATSTRPRWPGIEANGLFVGRVVDERVGDPGPRDYLVRSVVGVDRSTGAVAVDDRVPLGQHHPVPPPGRRDRRPRAEPRCWTGRRADAGLVFTCNGRGTRLFDDAHHDARAVARSVGSGAARRLLRRRGVRPGRRPQLRPSVQRVDGPVPIPLTGRPVAAEPPAAGRCRRTSPGPDAADRVAANDCEPSAPRDPDRRRRPRAARHQRHPGAGHGRPAGGQLRPPGHGHGPGPAGPRAVHPGHAPRPVRARTGPTATASSSPTATPRSCCTRCCT